MTDLKIRISELDRENGQLRALLAVALEDTARIDHLEANPQEGEVVVDGERKAVKVYAVVTELPLRVALDVHRKTLQ